MRVKPIPIRILLSILAQSHASTNPHTKATGDMIALAFFFLLRPGEYTASSTTTPFTLGDTQLFIGRNRIDLANAPDTDIAAATFASLTFTTQKNGVRGEVVGLGRSGRYFACPVLALANRVLHLRQCQAPPTTPLASYFDGTQLKIVTSADITATLKLAVRLLGPACGFQAADVTARSLRAAGAMALLCADVDTNIIHLIGRWQSDAMLRYLHVQAKPVMRDFARRMLDSGDFVLHPNATVPFSS